jgi:phthiocerol/phenolphthiocerol synthesis type-I polyketide synthase C
MKDEGEVAIVGYACRLPGARDSRALWKLLQDNHCAIGTIDGSRFPTDALHHPAREARGRSYTFAAGTIDDPWGFDAAAFGISPREAEQIDPQQRHLLEVAFEALHHAGIAPSRLSGSHTGVYVGASSLDYAARFLHDPPASDVHMMTGNTLSLLSNRLSYVLDLHGPSLTVDTACSSSLVALCQAADAIRAGTIDTAIVGGVNMLLSPFPFVGFARASMLSPSGRCRPFDAEADGYVRGEGVVAVILQSREAARRDGTRPLGLLAGWAVGQDGRTTGVSLPSVEAQQKLLEQLYRRFALDPTQLAFVEAHGTGTPAGDPIEAEALGRALGWARRRPLTIGSIKSNVGHLEPAAGLAGLLKALLSLRHRLLPASLSCATPNPSIAFEDLNLAVAQSNQLLLVDRATLAGVNSFGFGGTIAHAVLRHAGVPRQNGVLIAGPLPPLLLSAHSRPALEEMAKRHAETWPSDEVAAREWIDTHAFRRDRHLHRLTLLGTAPDAVRQGLKDHVAGADTCIVGEALGEKVPAVFVFNGNGAQWVGMARDAWAGNAAFRSAMEEVDGRFVALTGVSPLDTFHSDALERDLRRATTAQPLLFSIHYAIVQALAEQGLSAGATVGHSIGEVAAAWAAGVLSLDDAVRVIRARSLHQEPTRGSGSMVAVLQPADEVSRMLATKGLSGIEVAAINSARSVTVSGPDCQLEEVVQLAAENRWSAVRLDLDYPFHSALVEQVRAPLLRDLARLAPHKAALPFYSTVTGGLCPDGAAVAEHWWRNVREPVRFKAAIDASIKDGFRLFVEIGPKAILGGYLRDILREHGVRGLALNTLTQGQQNEEAADRRQTMDRASSDGGRPIDPLARTVARALVAGADIDFERLYGPVRTTCAQLPAYPWQHKPYKVEPTTEATGAFTDDLHPLLGKQVRAGVWSWINALDSQRHGWLADHRVGDSVLLPAAAFAESMLAATHQVAGADRKLRDLDIFHPLPLDAGATSETQVRISPDCSYVEFLSRPHLTNADWTLHARATISTDDVVTDAEETTIRALMKAQSGDGTPLRRTMSGEALYAQSQAAGFNYGPHFRRAAQVHVFGNASAIIDFMPAQAEAAWIVDPTALDAALHGLLALSIAAAPSAETEDRDPPLLLPVHIGSLVVVRPHAQITRALLTVQMRGVRSAVVDVTLLDEAGSIAVKARSIRFAMAPRSARRAFPILEERLLEQDRPGQTARLPGATDAIPWAGADHAAYGLIDQACQRIAWERVRACATAGTGDDDPEMDRAAETQRHALLWWLEKSGLAWQSADGWTMAAQCPVPDVGTIVQRLTKEHPAFGLEAAWLARQAEALGSAGFGITAEEARRLERQLHTAAASVESLRQLATRQAIAALSAAPAHRIVRMLLISAEHSDIALALARRFPVLEVAVTDASTERVAEAEALWSGEAPAHVTWHDPKGLDDLEAESFDFVVAVDALHALTIERGSLEGVRRLMRPEAQLIAVEPSPALFWDLLRGEAPFWWRRTVTPAFPVSALLSAEDWLAELADAGFDGEARAIDNNSLILTAGTIAPVRPLAESQPPSVTFEIAGEEGVLRSSLAALFAQEKQQLRARDGHRNSAVVWIVDNSAEEADGAERLTGRLTALADFLAKSDADRPLWVAGWTSLFNTEDGAAHVSDPTWQALVAALRVAQNEQPDRRIAAIGLDRRLSPVDASSLLKQEIATAGLEREVVIAPDRRFVTRIATMPSAPPQQASESTMLQLERGSKGTTAWTVRPRRALRPNEIEIAVHATGLNFRDVMWSLGLLPEEALEGGYCGTALGMECAGIVTAAGSPDSPYPPGTRVVAFASAAFATHVVAEQNAVMQLPDNICFEAAAALPVAYLTASYALLHKGELKAGESVLIHGAAGGVGLAALQIAKRAGAKVFATAGTPEKRSLLRALGADHAFDSRSLRFAEEVDRETGGRGVDVVLNSLAGEAMARSMECLAPFGRFLELGKRDFYANTRVALRPFRQNASYHAIDVDRLLGRDWSLARRLLGQVIDLVDAGELVPLPYRVFAGEAFHDAFRFMQRSRHVGKIVVTPPRSATATDDTAARFVASETGLHVVVGGLGGFGMTTVQWLADRGARHFLLIGRTAIPTAAQTAFLDQMTVRGVQADIAVVDASDGDALRACLWDANRRRTICGITHAAMVLDDRPITRIDRAAIAPVVAIKAGAAAAIEQVSRALSLDYLLLFSSATTAVGNPGQFNYVAANGFLEGLAWRLRAAGKPALTVAWGAIGDAGYLARTLDGSRALRRRLGETLLKAREGLDTLDRLLTQHGSAVPIVARIDWDQAHRELQTVRTTLCSRIHCRRSQTAVANSDLMRHIRELPIEQRDIALAELLRSEISRALRLPVADISLSTSLADVGMDSLMMLELRSAIEEKLDIELPIMTLNAGLTPADLITRLAGLIDEPRDAATELPRTLGALAGSHIEIGMMEPAVYSSGGAAIVGRARNLERLI